MLKEFNAWLKASGYDVYPKDHRDMMYWGWKAALRSNKHTDHSEDMLGMVGEAFLKQPPSDSGMIKALESVENKHPYSCPKCGESKQLGEMTTCYPGDTDMYCFKCKHEWDQSTQNTEKAWEPHWVENPTKTPE